MRRILPVVVFAALIAAPPISAPAFAASGIDAESGHYVLDPAHTSVTWKVKHLGLSNYTARFAKIDSTVDLDAATPANSKLTVTIDANSVRTDFPFPEKTNFDKEVGGDARFLDGEKNPEIKFVATKITATGPKSGTVTGNLTLRGVTKPITLDAVFNGTMKANAMMGAAKFGISAHGSIKRADFGMTYGGQFLGDTVELLIEAEYKLVK